MGNKSKKRSKKMPARSGKQTGRTSIKNKTPTKTAEKPKSLIQSNPKLAALVLVVTYFLLDYVMMDMAEGLPVVLTVIFTLLASSILYSYYACDYQRGSYPSGGTDLPKFIKDKRKYVISGWLLIMAWGAMLLIAEPFIVPRFFPVLDSTYYQPQIMLMVFIAPVMEEIIFRYLLYDRWLRRKWGCLWGFVVSSLIFVVCHPVTNVHSMVIYWAPTLLFFLVYHEFGLYGAIMIHMVYNMMAI